MHHQVWVAPLIEYLWTYLPQAHGHIWIRHRWHGVIQVYSYDDAGDYEHDFLVPMSFEDVRAAYFEGHLLDVIEERHLEYLEQQRQIGSL